MRKLGLIFGYILAIIITIFLLLPFLFGIITEKRCNQLIATINATTPLTAKVITYQRGWFSAKATATAALNNLKLSDNKLKQTTITAEIAHGPVFIDWIRFHFAQATIKVKFYLNKEQNDWLNLPADSKPIANARIKFRLSGDTTIVFDSPKFNYTNDDMSIDWEGLYIRSTFSHLNNQTKSTLNFSGLNLNINQHELNIGKATGSYQGNKTKHGLWAGERKFHIDSFKSKNPNNHIISFEDVDLNILITEQNTKDINIKSILAINNLNINDGLYTKNKIDLELNNLDQIALVKLQQQLIVSKLDHEAPGVGLNNIIPILNKGSKIKILALDTDTPWGKLLSDLQISFANQPNNNSVLSTIISSTISTNIKAGQPLLLHLLEKFYQIIPIKSDKNTPSQQAETLLNSWLQSGRIITSSDDQYLYIKFNYKNGQPSINNQDITLTIQP